jgi:hypothetical protein
MSVLKLQSNWKPALGKSEVDSTIASLKILVGAENITEYQGYDEPDGDHLVVPIYSLAEWIAENWWSLLYEPRKNEDRDDVKTDNGFTQRHSFIAAQHGFVLPPILFDPTGDEILVTSQKKRPAFADIRFKNQASVNIPRKTVAAELMRFISVVVERLDSQNIGGTHLHEALSLLQGTNADESLFCRLIGSLGLSPYDDNPMIEGIVERAIEAFGESATSDLCLVATPETISVAAELANEALTITKNAQSIPLAELLTINPPTNNITLPAWRRGVQAAKKIRDKFGISEIDPYGSQIIFNNLGINFQDDILLRNSVDDQTQLAITGAMVRDGSRAKIGLPQRRPLQRRFTAARGIFAAWTSPTVYESRLITQSVTREQQESRAFAAELTAPLAYIRSRKLRNRLTPELVNDIAEELSIGQDVVRYQMLNNGMAIVRS